MSGASGLFGPAVAVFGHELLEAARAVEVADAVLFEVIEKGWDGAGGGARCGAGAVARAVWDGEVFGECAESEALQLRQQLARERDRADVRVHHPTAGEDVR